MTQRQRRWNRCRISHPAGGRLPTSARGPRLEWNTPGRLWSGAIARHCWLRQVLRPCICSTPARWPPLRITHRPPESWLRICRLRERRLRNAQCWKSNWRAYNNWRKSEQFRFACGCVQRAKQTKFLVGILLLPKREHPSFPNSPGTSRAKFKKALFWMQHEYTHCIHRGKTFSKTCSARCGGCVDLAGGAGADLPA